MASGDSKVYFDAGSYPEYETAKRKGISTVKLIMFAELFGTPLILVLIFFLIATSPSSDIDLAILGPVFLAIAVAGAVSSYLFVTPMLRKRWAVPPRITDRGLELNTRVVPLNEIEEITIIGNYLHVVWMPPGARLYQSRPFSKGELGDEEEFIRILRERRPGIKIDDKMARKHP